MAINGIVAPKYAVLQFNKLGTDTCYAKYEPIYCEDPFTLEFDAACQMCNSFGRNDSATHRYELALRLLATIDMTPDRLLSDFNTIKEKKQEIFDSCKNVKVGKPPRKRVRKRFS